MIKLALIFIYFILATLVVGIVIIGPKFYRANFDSKHWSYHTVPLLLFPAIIYLCIAATHGIKIILASPFMLISTVYKLLRPFRWKVYKDHKENPTDKIKNYYIMMNESYPGNFYKCAYDELDMAIKEGIKSKFDKQNKQHFKHTKVFDENASHKKISIRWDGEGDSIFYISVHLKKMFI